MGSKLRERKMLVLGGKPIGSVELVERANELGIYTIVTDYLPKKQSPAKLIANESWDISTNEVDEIIKLCKEKEVDAILTGVHEFNINRMIDISELSSMPSYCSRNTWKYADNKKYFKELCSDSNIPVAKQYLINIKDNITHELIDYPVIVKPADGSGSRGFKICSNIEELIKAYSNASTFSPTNSVLVEDYIPYESVIIHYTMIQGKCCFSGISDKYSSTFPSTGASVMGLQIFPSIGEQEYLKKLDTKVRLMFENAGFTNGPLWIEAFYDGNNKFIFNEMGYRFGGSLTYFPVKYFYGIDQLDMLIESAFGINKDIEVVRRKVNKKYCILPIHIKPGTITAIKGVEEILSKSDVEAIVKVHYLGDKIEDWGSAQQVFAYLHVTFEEEKELRKKLFDILNQLEVIDENGNNMLFTLFDIENDPIRMN